MHMTCRAAVGITARSIGPDSSRARCKPDLERVEEHAAGVVRINNHSLVVPVLWVIAGDVLAIPERTALGTLHEGPACTAVSRSPRTNLAARGVAAATVAVTNNGLDLGIDVVGVAGRDGNVNSAQ